jgi:hypothetical protein
MLDVAGELYRHCAPRAAIAEIAIGIGAVSKDRRHARQGDDIVDDGRPPEGAFMRRQRRLGADLAALAFQAVQQRGFLAADIGAGADPDLDVENVGRAGYTPAQ